MASLRHLSSRLSSRFRSRFHPSLSSSPAGMSSSGPHNQDSSPQRRSSRYVLWKSRTSSSSSSGTTMSSGAAREYGSSSTSSRNVDLATPTKMARENEGGGISSSSVAVPRSDERNMVEEDEVLVVWEGEGPPSHPVKKSSRSRADPFSKPSAPRPPPPTSSVPSFMNAFSSAEQEQEQEHQQEQSPPFLREWQSTKFGEEMSARKLTKKTDTEFTFLSYNVLADKLMRDHPELYRDVPSDIIGWETRYPKLIREILDCQADIVCLQEVQADHYSSHFLKDLTPSGYEGIYKQRTGPYMDGCAIFFKKEKFFLEESLGVEYNQPGVDCLDRNNVALLARLGTRNNLQLRNQDPRLQNEKSYTKLVVANTHLLYNPNRQDVKLAQAVVLLAELDRFSTPLGRQHRLPCIVAGDFNLSSESPVFEFLTRGEFWYRGLYSRQLTEYGNGKVLSNELLPQKLGITDNCKHIDTLEERRKSSSPGGASFGIGFDEPTVDFVHCQGHRLNSTGATTAEGCERRSGPPPHSNEFGSGKFTHDFGLRSVYGSLGTVCTTRQDKWIAVDYVFYSTYFSKQFSKHIEGSLKLVAKLQLPNRRQCEKMRGLPTNLHPSDHFPLLCKFLIRGTNFRG